MAVFVVVVVVHFGSLWWLCVLRSRCRCEESNDVRIGLITFRYRRVQPVPFFLSSVWGFFFQSCESFFSFSVSFFVHCFFFPMVQFVLIYSRFLSLSIITR